MNVKTGKVVTEKKSGKFSAIPFGKSIAKVALSHSPVG